MPEIYKIIVIAFVLSLAVAFIILFGNKTELRYKLRDIFDREGVSLIAKMLDCDFCLSFWLLVLATMIFGVISGEGLCLLLIPFIATPLTRFWL